MSREEVLTRELVTTRRQLQRVAERNASAFDRGFEAAARMAKAGASPERLLDACAIPEYIPERDTEPTLCPAGQAVEDEEVTQVFHRPEAS